MKQDLSANLSPYLLLSQHPPCASVAYLIAMRDEKLPRKPLPRPRKKP